MNESELALCAAQLFKQYQSNPDAPKVDFRQAIAVGAGFTLAVSGNIVAHCANLDTGEDEQEPVISFCIHDDSKGGISFDLFSGVAANAEEFWKIYDECLKAFEAAKA